MNATIAKLREIIRPYVKELDALENLTQETDFINDLKINSANLVDIVLDIEEAFDIEIDNQSMEKMLSVRAALEIIDEKLAGKA
ncbi:acyl carrier protein [Flavobacterium magnum]|uniref:Acyl carrier protein n=1 Tax=Flavobacterium magnum TaxID=2162713 RepID=A0A2S0RFA5_9FLAO|nr:phosphopantetheine-binding protein [Flavobacterium magnum]AWA30617.1 acyl carrier protein [Flavobacterium magnum]